MARRGRFQNFATLKREPQVLATYRGAAERWETGDWILPPVSLRPLAHSNGMQRHWKARKVSIPFVGKSDMKYISGAELVSTAAWLSREADTGAAVDPFLPLRSYQQRAADVSTAVRPSSTAGRCCAQGRVHGRLAARRERCRRLGSFPRSSGGLLPDRPGMRAAALSHKVCALGVVVRHARKHADLLNSVAQPPHQGADASAGAKLHLGWCRWVHVLAQRSWRQPEVSAAAVPAPDVVAHQLRARSARCCSSMCGGSEIGVQGLAGLLRASSGATKAWGPAAADADSQPQSSVTRANELQDAARQKAQQLFTRLAQQAAQPLAAPSAPAPKPGSYAHSPPRQRAPTAPPPPPPSSRRRPPRWPPRPLRSLRCRHSSRCWPKSDEPRRRRRCRIVGEPGRSRSLLQRCACAAARRRSQHERRKRHSRRG